MADTEPDFAALVNASGFMLQMAVEHAVETSQNSHGFAIEGREHPWHHAELSGFIDLIFGRGTIRLVCECKRSRDANWVFLVEHNDPEASRARLRWIHSRKSQRLSGWDDFPLTTRSPEALFCVVRGQGENDTPLLERVASRLIMSVEALSDEEERLRDAAEERDSSRVYIPMIVTTAQLWVYRYRPDAIDLSNGMVDSGQAEEVPCVRFRKAFTTSADVSPSTQGEMPYQRFRRISREQERTVLVVNSAALPGMLISWRNGVVQQDWSAPWSAYER